MATEAESYDDSVAKRLVFLGPDKQPFYIMETITIPALKPGQVLARIRLATICGSDLHTITGKRREPTPSILGHEAVAEVIRHERGPEFECKPGDRITFSIADSCDECQRCRHGLPQKCVKLFKYGHSRLETGSGLAGCYATHIILQPGTSVVQIPDTITDKMAASINCALATMVNAVYSITHEHVENKVALVQGAGLLGIFGCTLLHEAGYEKVYCADVNVDKLKLISRFGAIPLVSGMSGKNNPKLNENDVDVIIEACGASAVVEEGIQLLKPGGTYVLVGLVHPDSPIYLQGDKLIRKCLTIKGVHNYAPRHLKLAVEFLAKTSTKYPYERLVGPLYKLSQFESAVKDSLSGRYWRVGIMPGVE
ncbi:L-threonine 3-dehydrogenase-like [Amphiura filiformis]|uniref:L-threonine 3-dehydrogenase-like n=1 Tax=Amphiura filiformis TaxID=82378 RepID=UPI003B215737